jgi:hypothetical protein
MEALGLRHLRGDERGQLVQLPLATSAEKENPGSPNGARGSLLPVEAAGIEPAVWHSQSGLGGVSWEAGGSLCPGEV